MTTNQLPLDDAFELHARPDGETFYALADDAPDWLRDAVRDAHGSLMPDDWTYRICANVAEALADGGIDEPYELADSLVDIYNADRLAWLSAHWENVDRVDYVLDQYRPDHPDIVSAIGIAQCDAIAEIIAVMVEAYEESEES